MLTAVIFIGLYAWRPAPAYPRPLAAIALADARISLVWYVLHPLVLHSRWMFKIKPLASTWKRIHYDHTRIQSSRSLVRRTTHNIATIAIARADRLCGLAAWRRPA